MNQIEPTKNLTLMQNIGEYGALVDLLRECGGELSEGLVEKTVDGWLAEIQTNMAVKVDGYYFKQEAIEAMAAQLKIEQDEYTVAIRGLNNLGKALKERLKFAMNQMETDELIGNRQRFKLTLSAPRVVIEDETLIPATFCRERVIIEVDKDLVKKHAMEFGEVIPGVKSFQG